MDRRILIIIVIFIAGALSFFLYQKLYCKPAGVNYEIRPIGAISVGDSIFYLDKTPGATRHKWNFGDDEFSTEKSGWHVFLTPGPFKINLTTYGSFGALNKTCAIVNVHAKYISTPEVLISGPSSIYVGQNGVWQSPVSAERYEWYLGDAADGHFSSNDQKIFTVSFSTPGKKSIELRTKQPESTQKTDIMVLAQPGLLIKHKVEHHQQKGYKVHGKDSTLDHDFEHSSRDKRD